MLEVGKKEAPSNSQKAGSRPSCKEKGKERWKILQKSQSKKGQHTQLIYTVTSHHIHPSDPISRSSLFSCKNPAYLGGKSDNLRAWASHRPSCLHTAGLTLSGSTMSKSPCPSRKYLAPLCPQRQASTPSSWRQSSSPCSIPALLTTLAHRIHTGSSDRSAK